MNNILLLFCIAFSAIAVAEKKVVCYHGTWSVYRNSLGKFQVTDIDPRICTHLIYALFGITETGEFKVLSPDLDLEENGGKGNVKKFNALKQINPKLKTLAAVGGWNEGSYKYSLVAKDPAKRRRFVETSVAFLKQHGFDGLDMDWEYPAQRDGDPSADKQNFSILMRELKEELSKHGMLLTAAVAAAEFSASLSYDIREIAKHLDFINVMAYDLHGSWDPVVGIHSPLYASPADSTPLQKQLNAYSAIKYWLSQGAPARKLILGVPFYARTFTLQNPGLTKVGSPSVGPGQPGKYTNEQGFVGYNEICELLQAGGWQVEWEDHQKVPYAYKGNQWIGYDDEKSLEFKAKFVHDLNLGGMMVWSIETDDFRGVCGLKYPLLRKINDLMGKAVPNPEPPVTQPPHHTSTSTPPPPQTQPPAGGECTRDGTFRDPNDPGAFYTCIHGRRYNFRCPDGLVFNEKLGICDYPHNVPK